jgi:hypothetical protein
MRVCLNLDPSRLLRWHLWVAETLAELPGNEVFRTFSSGRRPLPAVCLLLFEFERLLYGTRRNGAAGEGRQDMGGRLAHRRIGGPARQRRSSLPRTHRRGPQLPRRSVSIPAPYARFRTVPGTMAGESGSAGWTHWTIRRSNKLRWAAFDQDRSGVTPITAGPDSRSSTCSSRTV